MNIEDLQNYKTWIISDNYDETFVFYSSKCENKPLNSHLFDLNDFSKKSHLNLTSETVWGGALELATQNNIISINNGEYLIIFFPKDLSDNQRESLKQLKSALGNFKKIYSVRITDNETFAYETFENNDGNKTEVEYLFSILKNKIKELA